MPEVTALINEVFPPTTDSVEYIKGIPIQELNLEEVRSLISLKKTFNKFGFRVLGKI